MQTDNENQIEPESMTRSLYAAGCIRTPPPALKAALAPDCRRHRRDGGHDA
jgi:hypothetical protein